MRRTNMKDLVIFVKNDEKIIRIAEGDGCNLTDEDIKDGYVDYLYYDIFDAQDFQDVEDGGMVLLEKPVKDEFNSIGEVIKRVLNMAGYIKMPVYYMLSGEDDWIALVGKPEEDK
jgi:hypothetical protein